VDASAARDEAQRLLRDLVPMVRDLGPTALRTNGAVFWAAAVVWELKAREHAEAYESLALEHQAAGLGDYPHGCHDLAIAWMRTLGGNLPGANDAFAQARARLRADGRRPLQPIVDFHEAEALARQPAPDRARIDALLRAALPQFQALGMAGWVARTHTLLESGRLVIGYPSRTRLPSGLTEREGEILRLLAGGSTSREIAERLVLSVPTVQNHVANIYRKIDVRSRSEATAYAIRHGLTELPSSQDR
jgi:DNA-binding CsgD family transcriptional regulator